MSDVLLDPSFLPEGGTIGFGLCHQYSFREHIEAYKKRNRDDDHKALQNIFNILKGNDRATYNLCKEFGLLPKMRVIYECYDGNALVMLDYIVDEGNGGGGPRDDNYNFVKDELIKDMGGIWIDCGGPAHHEEDEDDETYEEKIRWITKMTTFNATDFPNLIPDSVTK